MSEVGCRPEVAMAAISVGMVVVRERLDGRRICHVGLSMLDGRKTGLALFQVRGHLVEHAGLRGLESTAVTQRVKAFQAISIVVLGPAEMLNANGNRQLMLRAQRQRGIRYLQN